jgi:hypothetical protein
VSAGWAARFFSLIRRWGRLSRARDVAGRERLHAAHVEHDEAGMPRVQGDVDVPAVGLEGEQLLEVGPGLGRRGGGHVGHGSSACSRAGIVPPLNEGQCARTRAADPEAGTTMYVKILPMPRPLRPDRRRVAALAYDRMAAFEFGIVAEVFGCPGPR